MTKEEVNHLIKREEYGVQGDSPTDQQTQRLPLPPEADEELEPETDVAMLCFRKKTFRVYRQQLLSKKTFLSPCSSIAL